MCCLEVATRGLAGSGNLRNVRGLGRDDDSVTKHDKSARDCRDTLAWQEDSDWTYMASWTQDVALSTDSSEGVTTWTLNLN